MGLGVVFLGPPGSGKGTQAKVFTESHNFKHYSTGDLLRNAVKNKTPVGLEASDYMNRGDLVPDKVILNIIKDVLVSENPDKFLLDGFPRNKLQADSLDQMLLELNRELSHVIYFNLSDEEVVKRLTGRRVCSKCTKNYHILFEKPQKDGVCDQCGEQLYQREDDNETTVRKRLDVYKESTLPLLDYYEKKNLLREVDASQEIDKVTSKLTSLLSA